MKEKGLQIFNNEDLKIKVRILRNDNGEIMFNAEDTAIGFGWTQEQIKYGKKYFSIRWERINDVCKEISFPHELGKESYIPESVFYRLAMKANNKKADDFQNWVATKVIPEARKRFESQFLIPKTFSEALQLAANLQKKIEEQKPLVEFANKVGDSSDLITMNQMAKLLYDEGINIGRNKLFAWLRSKNILRHNNEPYQRFIKEGYFEVKEKVQDTAYGSKLFTQTFVTGKGQIYIAEKLRKEYTN